MAGFVHFTTGIVDAVWSIGVGMLFIGVHVMISRRVN